MVLAGETERCAAYQIDRDELVFRAREWANETSSKEALVDEYDLRQTY